jgi:hypothetical protein
MSQMCNELDYYIFKNIAPEICSLCSQNDEAAIEFVKLLETNTNGEDYCRTWMCSFNQASFQFLTPKDKLRHLYNLMQVQDIFQEENVVEAFKALGKSNGIIDPDTLANLNEWVNKISSQSSEYYGDFYSSNQLETSVLQQETERLQALLAQEQQVMSQIESVFSKSLTFCENSWDGNRFYKFANHFVYKVPNEARSSDVYTIMRNFTTVHERVTQCKYRLQDIELIKKFGLQISNTGSILGVNNPYPDYPYHKRFLDWSCRVQKLQNGIKFTDVQAAALHELLQLAKEIQEELTSDRYWRIGDYLKDLINNLTEICALIEKNPEQWLDTSTQLDESQNQPQEDSVDLKKENESQVTSADQQPDSDVSLQEKSEQPNVSDGEAVASAVQTDISVDPVGQQSEDTVGSQKENEQLNASNNGDVSLQEESKSQVTSADQQPDVKDSSQGESEQSITSNGDGHKESTAAASDVKPNVSVDPVVQQPEDPVGSQKENEQLNASNGDGHEEPTADASNVKSDASVDPVVQQPENPVDLQEKGKHPSASNDETAKDADGNQEQIVDTDISVASVDQQSNGDGSLQEKSKSQVAPAVKQSDSNVGLRKESEWQSNDIENEFKEFQNEFKKFQEEHWIIACFPKPIVKLIFTWCYRRTEALLQARKACDEQSSLKSSLTQDESSLLPQNEQNELATQEQQLV